MALDTVSHFFDNCRQQGKKGEETLQLIRENISKSIRKSSLGKYSKYCDVPDEEFRSWLDSLLGQESLNKEQTNEVRRQLSLRLKRIEEDSCIALWKYWLRPVLNPVSVLLIVDVQNDFITGSLALKHCPAGEDGEEVVPVIQDLLSRNLFSIVGYTFDWHPPNHCSFIDNVSLYPLHSSSPVQCAENAKIFDVVIYDKTPLIDQVLWPRHCQIDSWGAELHKEVTPPGNGDITVKKGSNPRVDSYSAFWDNADCSQTSLFLDLLKHGVTDVFICGLAFDVCVKHSAIDAVEQGFKTHVIADGCRGVTNEGIAKTKDEFLKKGVVIIESNKVCQAVDEYLRSINLHVLCKVSMGDHFPFSPETDNSPQQMREAARKGC